MAKETVEAVRQAELKAARLEEEAMVKKNELIQKAMEDAKVLVSTRVKESLKESSKRLEQANVANEALLQDAAIRGDSEIKLLLESIEARKNQAIDLILQEVI